MTTELVAWAALGPLIDRFSSAQAELDAAREALEHLGDGESLEEASDGVERLKQERDRAACTLGFRAAELKRQLQARPG